MHRLRSAGLLSLAALAVGCSGPCREPAAPTLAPDAAEITTDGSTAFGEPGGEVRAYPPHAIRPGGVGPYALGAPLTDVLHLIPRGPRIELVRMGSKVNWRMVPAESGDLLIGADSHNRVAFVTVLAPEVGRTENGIHVGMTTRELFETLAPELVPFHTAWAGRIYELPPLPGVYFVADSVGPEAELVALVVARPGLLSPPSLVEASERPPPSACHRPWPVAEINRALAETGKSADDLRRLLFGCFTSHEPELLLVEGATLIVVAGTTDAGYRVHAEYPLPPAQAWLTSDVDGDGKDELALARVVKSDTAAVIEAEVHEPAGRRLVQILSEQAFRVTDDDAQTAGLTLAELEIILALREESSVPYVHALIATRSRGTTRDIVPMTPVPLRIGVPQLRP